jgi:hypothetical protein
MANMTYNRSCILLMSFFLCVFRNTVNAQPPACSFAAPIVKIDFGTNANPESINLSSLKKYSAINGSCPDDGHYSFVAGTKNCFRGNWHTLLFDHTEADTDGRMMIVNASETPGVFFLLNIAGLKAGGTYQFTGWFANICRSGNGCIPTPPSLAVSVFAEGRLLNTFRTGEIRPGYFPEWKAYSAVFTLPQNAESITLQMEDLTNGGCGNDFAMDDVTLQECVVPPPAIEKKVPPAPVPLPKPIPEIKRKEPMPVPIVKKEPEIKKVPQQNSPLLNLPAPDTVKKIVTLPAPIAARANPVIKKIETEESEIIIELYDNGEIDGDTVSIYHNNKLITSRAGLSAKPITLKIKADAQQPHHELVMVANNLGSIPPNTSLMIISTKSKRYEIFISSSEQKNAKIVIDLKE